MDLENLKKISGSEIDKMLSDGITIVNFYADWCGPCKMMVPVFEQIAAENKNLTVLKVNVDSNRAEALQYGVSGIPATFIFKNKKRVFEAPIAGYMSKQELTDKLNQI